MMHFRFLRRLKSGQLGCGDKRVRLRLTARKKSTASSELPDSPEGGRLVALGTTYLTLLGANFISNAMIHPIAKIDYGLMNVLFPDGREVGHPFWGSRLPHLFGIPACLMFYEHVVTGVFSRYMGLVSYAVTPSLSLLNLFCYTWLAVGTFITVDSICNPDYEGHRMNHLVGSIKPLTIGMSLQWHLQLMIETFGSTGVGPMAIARNAMAISLVFFPVKALGFGDVGAQGLTPHERKMNGLLALE